MVAAEKNTNGLVTKDGDVMLNYYGPLGPAPAGSESPHVPHPQRGHATGNLSKRYAFLHHCLCCNVLCKHCVLTDGEAEKLDKQVGGLKNGRSSPTGSPKLDGMSQRNRQLIFSLSGGSSGSQSTPATGWKRAGKTAMGKSPAGAEAFAFASS